MLESTVLIRVVVLVAAAVVAPLAGGVPPSDCPSTLFRVERSLNANVVVYEANRGRDGTIDEKHPVRPHWVMNAEQGQVEELTYLERVAWFGVDARKALDPGSFLLRVRAFPKPTILLRDEEGCARGYLMIGGRLASLARVFVTLRGSGLHIKVTSLEFNGVDAQTQEELAEKIDLSIPVPAAAEELPAAR